MKKKILITIFIVLMGFLKQQAQDLSVFDRHNGIIMNRKLAIEFNEDKKKFYYYKDNHDMLELNNNDLFNIKGSDDGKYTMLIKFYNPLRVKFNFEETKVEDPAIAAINTFISKIPADLLSYKINSNSEQQSASYQIFSSDMSWQKYFNAPSDLFMPDAYEMHELLDSFPVPNSIVLSQWLYELRIQVLSKAKNPSKYKELVKTLSVIPDIDTYLYGMISYGEKNEKNKNLNQWLLSVQDNLFDQVTMESFKDKLKDAHKIKEALELSQKKAEDALQSFHDLVFNKYDGKIGSLIFVDDKNVIRQKVGKTSPEEDRLHNLMEDFKSFSQAYYINLLITIDARKKNNDEALEKLNMYLNTLDKFIINFDTNGYKVLQTSQISQKEGKIKVVDISAVKLEKGGKEITDTKSTVSFLIARWNSVYPYISAGTIFTNFSFPDYNISLNPGGGGSVIDASEKKLRANPCLFLNFVFNIHSDYLYPVLQFGVSTAEKSILLPIGAGFSIGDRVTISGGFLPAFVKELNSLKVGDPIDSPDVLNKDLSYRLKSSGYFAININLSKFK